MIFKARVERERAARSIAKREFVLSTIPQGTNGAEVGVWRGDFSEALIRRTRPARLHLIDPWRFLSDPGLEGGTFSGGSATDQRNLDQVHDNVVARFRKEIDDGTVIVHRVPADDGLAALEPLSLDWIYIDGNHRYENVRDELAASLRLIKPGGIIAGDDYANPGWWEDGVTRAVDEFVAAGHAEVIQIANHQFVLRRPS